MGLITSQGFGGSVDSPDIITANTRSSLVALKAFIGPAEQIFSPKINAGIFRTPWETTEKVIEESGFERWTVCALDGSGATNLHK